MFFLPHSWSTFDSHGGSSVVFVCVLSLARVVEPLTVVSTCPPRSYARALWLLRLARVVETTYRRRFYLSLVPDTWETSCAGLSRPGSWPCSCIPPCASFICFFSSLDFFFFFFFPLWFEARLFHNVWCWSFSHLIGPRIPPRASFICFLCVSLEIFVSFSVFEARLFHNVWLGPFSD